MTLVIAHRGASAYHPENTIAAFRAAVEFEADGIELDVHGSADGVLVVHHDPVLDDLDIRELSYTDLRNRLDAKGGHAVPATLPETLDAIGKDTTVYIEVKSLDPAFDENLMSVIAAAPNPKNCQVHGFDHRIVRRLVTANPGLPGGVLSASYPIHPITPIIDASATTLWQQGTLIDESLVDRVHAQDMTLIAWTVDDPDHMVYLRRIGVDGVCSNTPDVARRVLR